MLVRFVSPDLRRLDELRGEALCTGLFEEERPPSGVLGLVDWRLAGWISQAVAEGRIDGRWDGRWLVSVGGAFPFEKLFVFGLGAREAFDGQRQVRVVDAMLRTFRRGRVRSTALALPGRSLGEGEALAAAEYLAERLLQAGEPDEVVVVEEAKRQRDLERAVARARRRSSLAQAEAGRSSS